MSRITALLTQASRWLTKPRETQIRHVQMSASKRAIPFVDADVDVAMLEGLTTRELELLAEDQCVYCAEKLPNAWYKYSLFPCIDCGPIRDLALQILAKRKDAP